MSVPPLYVDLDGTLLKTDLLWESLLTAGRRDPVGAARAALLAILRGRAALKRALAERASIDPAQLPYDEALLAWLSEEARQGRRLYIATAADRSLADAVARHLGIFQGVIASDGAANTKGTAKLTAIRQANEGGPFAYAGNGREDLPIFAAADEAIVVAASPSVERRARAQGNVERVFTRTGSPAAWIRALRPHQWLKNLLVFVPLLTAFRIADVSGLGPTALAFVAFCLVASAGYVVNDLLDLSSDRQHPRKRARPFASGALSIPAGMAGGFVLAAAGFAIAAWLSAAVLSWVAAYLTLTLVYSLRLKRIAVWDVFTLAGLYTSRIAVGGAAAHVALSFWLVAFSCFLFFALAIVKRCGELVAQRDRHESTSAGRGYRVGDLSVLMPLGIAASCNAVLVLALYVQTPEVLARYRTPQLLAGTLVAVFVWQVRLWLQTARGRMQDDPLLYALRDRESLLLIAIAGCSYAAAAMLPMS